MKSRAFTLVELLIVVSILGVLVALLAPQLSRARSLARQSVCAHRLEQLNRVFTVVNTSPSAGGVAPKAYVSPADWPAIPFQSCPKQELFMCGEDGDDHAGTATGALMYYSWHNVSHPMVPFSPDNQWVKSRRGSDNEGPYSEYTFGDTDAETADWAQDFHDGLIRVYDKAVDGKVKAVLLTYYCSAGPSMHNGVFLGDTRIWDFFTDHDPNLPKTAWLSTVITSYGINPAVNRNQVKPGTVVLMDFVKPVANPLAADFDDSFQKSGRHLGKMNVLFSDGSVRAMGQTALNPKFPGGDVLWAP